MYDYERFMIAHAALMFLIFWPCLIITFCALCMARRRNDPARRTFTFLKPALALFTLFVFLDFSSYALSVASIRLQDDRSISSYYSNAPSLIRSIRFAASETYAIGRLVESMCDIFVFLMLVNLGIGILIAQSGKAGGLSKIIKLGSLGMSAILTVIAIACFGLRTSFFSSVYGKYYMASYTTAMGKQYNNSRQLDFAFMVLIFVLSLAAVGQSIMVKMQTRTEQRVSTAANTFIACATLWLLRSVYYLASIAASTNLSNYLKDPTNFHYYYYILDVVLAAIPQLILLGLIFGLGNKKLNGLWSTEQPFLANQGDGVTPWGFSYDPNQGQAPPAMAQQQPIAQVQPQQQQAVPQQEWSQYQQQQYHQQQFQQQQQQFQQQYQQQQQQQQYQPYYPPQQPHYAAPASVSPVSSPTSHATSPPPHDIAMGLNHQANGTPPQAAPQPYHEKS